MPFAAVRNAEQVRKLEERPIRVRQRLRRGHAQPCMSRQQPHRAAREMLKMVRHVPIDPFSPKHARTPPTRIRGAEYRDSAWLEHLCDPPHDLQRIGSVLNDLVERHIVEEVLWKCGGVEQSDANIEAVVLRDALDIL